MWALVDGDLLEHMMAMNESDHKSWLFSMFESISPKRLTRLVVTLWAIWTARRKAIHVRIFQTPFATDEFVTWYILELDELKNCM